MAEWKFLIFIENESKKETTVGLANPAKALLPEFQRLAKQKCAYCSGWGHSGNDCPTDAKVSHLRGGVREQNTLLQ